MEATRRTCLGRSQHRPQGRPARTARRRWHTDPRRIAIDTAVDLLVYGLKYQTYLADLDSGVARLLFAAEIGPPFSDGTEAFDALLARCDVTALDHPVGVAPAVPAATVLTIFAGLEECLAADGEPGRRQGHARDLCSAAVGLIAALRHHDAGAFETFVETWQDDWQDER